MKVEPNSYQMILDKVITMIRNPALTNEELGETIATFLYDESIDNQVEILNYALLTALKNYRGKKAWEDREARKYQEDLRYRSLKIDDKGLVTEIGDSTNPSNPLFREQ